jgi:hypothetical protein
MNDYSVGADQELSSAFESEHVVGSSRPFFPFHHSSEVFAFLCHHYASKSITGKTTSMTTTERSISTSTAVVKQGSSHRVPRKPKSSNHFPRSNNVVWLYHMLVLKTTWFLALPKSVLPFRWVSCGVSILSCWQAVDSSNFQTHWNESFIRAW